MRKYSDSNTSSTYESVKDSYRVTSYLFKYLKYYVPKLTISAVHLSNSPYPPSMVFLSNFTFIPKGFNEYLPRIIFYMLSSDLYTWQYHVTIVFVLDYFRKKSSFIFLLVVLFPTFILYCVTSYFKILCFDVILLVTIVELKQISNTIQKF